MIERKRVDEFLNEAQKGLILDVRSPSEFIHAHIPGAISFPLFTDEERKVVGTAYKQQSRETAIKIGLDYFGPKMRKMVEEVEKLLEGRQKKVLVHCWRGGMRSGGVAWLLDLYGFEVITLEGGYKAFRNWALRQLTQAYHLKMVGGYTGSGKTEILKILQSKGEQTVDIERLANHKGSALGGINMPPQPSQEMFENLLAFELSKLDNIKPIWVEDESQRVGNRNIPNEFMEKMRQAPLYFLDIPFEKRLSYLVDNYGKLPTEKILNAIVRIKKRLGGLDTKNAMNYLVEGQTAKSFGILLQYYDKTYSRALEKHKGEVVKLITTELDMQMNTDLLLQKTPKNGRN